MSELFSCQIGNEPPKRSGPALVAAPDAIRDLFPLFGAAVQVRGTDIEGTLWGITPRGAIVDRTPKPLLTVDIASVILVEDGD